MDAQTSTIDCGTFGDAPIPHGTSRDRDAYLGYVRYCRSVDVTPASWDRWLELDRNSFKEFEK